MNQNEYIHKIIRETTNTESFAKMGKIRSVDPTGGTYTVELNGGEVMSFIKTQVSGLNIKYFVDQFVTLEFSGGDWQIAGTSALKGGD